MKPAIEHVPASEPHVYAFEISGEISDGDMTFMTTMMQSAFDKYPEVNMLLIFRDYDGSETGAGLNSEAMKAQWEALSNVKRYAVAGAPGYAETMIKIMDKIMPVNAQVFELSQLAEAWAFVGAKPKAL